MSREHLDLIRRAYAAFEQGDVPAILELFDPAIEWVAAENSPLADRSPYRGLDEVREGVFLRIAAEFPDLAVRVDELPDAGDRVVALGVYEGTRQAIGRRFRAQVAHVWTIAAGKVIRFQQYTDTLQLAESANQAAAFATLLPAERQEGVK